MPALPEALERPSWAAGCKEVHWRLGRAFSRPCCQPVDRSAVAFACCLASCLVCCLACCLACFLACSLACSLACCLASGFASGFACCLFGFGTCGGCSGCCSCCSGPWLLFVWVIGGMFLGQAIADGGQDQRVCCCFLKFIHLYTFAIPSPGTHPEEDLPEDAVCVDQARLCMNLFGCCSSFVVLRL